ncbi:hypothetical protein XHV734_2653 [Xanthomonas hortorum pv. vitians]|nr:hypothetical protein XHV734_2653 [Xanthomonas hortorum pv. vitians]
MDGAQFVVGSHGNTSVVIDNLNVLGAGVSPDKAHTPLVIDADAVLTCTRTRKKLKPIARRAAQELQRLRRIQQLQLPFGYSLHVQELPG